MRLFLIAAAVAVLNASVGLAQCFPDQTNVAGGLGITRVQLKTLDNHSGSPTNFYTNFTSITAPKLPVASTGTVIVTASTGFTIAIWFDWNNDLVFSPSEKLAEAVSADSNVTTLLNYVVPGFAIPGNTRMRIRAIQGVTGVDPCTSAAGGTDVGETQDYNVEVTPAIEVTTTTLAVAEVGFNYSQTLQATGGVGTLTWAHTGGTLPDGLVFQPSGLIVGVPRAGSNSTIPYPLSFLVTDQGTPQNGTLVNLNLTVFPFSGSPVTIVSSSLPNAVLNTTYTVQVQAASGANPNQSPSPYNFTINSLGGGSLPPGLGLSPLGLIQGTPAVVGVYSFQIDVEDPAGFTAFRNFSITVTDTTGGGGGGGGGGTGGTGTVTLKSGGNCAMVAVTGWREVGAIIILGLILLFIGRILMIRRRHRELEEARNGSHNPPVRRV